MSAWEILVSAVAGLMVLRRVVTKLISCPSTLIFLAFTIDILCLVFFFFKFIKTNQGRRRTLTVYRLNFFRRFSGHSPRLFSSTDSWS